MHTQLSPSISTHLLPPPLSSHQMRGNIDLNHYSIPLKPHLHLPFTPSPLRLPTPTLRLPTHTDIISAGISTRLSTSTTTPSPSSRTTPSPPRCSLSPSHTRLPFFNSPPRPPHPPYSHHLRGDIDTAIDLYHHSLSLKPDDTFTSEMLSFALKDSLEAQPDPTALLPPLSPMIAFRLGGEAGGAGGGKTAGWGRGGGAASSSDVARGAPAVYIAG